MGENEKSFQDDIKSMAMIVDLIDNTDILKDENITIKVILEKEKYKDIINHFREIDRNREEFNIKFDNVNFNFSLKK